MIFTVLLSLVDVCLAKKHKKGKHHKEESFDLNDDDDWAVKEWDSDSEDDFGDSFFGDIFDGISDIFEGDGKNYKASFHFSYSSGDGQKTYEYSYNSDKNEEAESSTSEAPMVEDDDDNIPKMNVEDYEVDDTTSAEDSEAAADTTEQEKTKDEL